jgi:hypothetical protein
MAQFQQLRCTAVQLPGNDQNLYMVQGGANHAHRIRRSNQTGRSGRMNRLMTRLMRGWLLLPVSLHTWSGRPLNAQRMARESNRRKQYKKLHGSEPPQVLPILDPSGTPASQDVTNSRNSRGSKTNIAGPALTKHEYARLPPGSTLITRRLARAQSSGASPTRLHFISQNSLS